MLVLLQMEAACRGGRGQALRATGVEGPCRGWRGSSEMWLLVPLMVVEGKWWWW